MSDELLKTVRNISRLAALHRTRLLDSPPEESFDRYTRIASRVTHAPTALVSLVDDRRQFFKSSFGLKEPYASRREMPLSHSFCKHVVETGSELVVGDARVVPLVRDNPAVVETKTVAYAGMPLATSDGHVLGTLCVFDTQPRRWTADELDVLRDLAQCLARDIQLNEQLRDAEEARRDAQMRLLAKPDAETH